MVMAKRVLVPQWSKEPKTKYSTINARIETVAEKPVYRTLGLGCNVRNVYLFHV